MTAGSASARLWQERCGAFLFTMIGGFLDAYAFLAHGGVFANAQTGNVVLMAVDIAESEWTKALGHLFPLVTFTAAALIVTLLNHRWEQHTTRLRLGCAAVEAAVFTVILAMQAKVPDSWVVPMISFAVAVQITSFGSVKGVTFNSGMTTGNLRKTVTALTRMLFGQDLEKSRETFLTVGTVCLSFLVGALAGGIVTKRDRAHCLMVPLLAIPVAAVLSRAREAPAPK